METLTSNKFLWTLIKSRIRSITLKDILSMLLFCVMLYVVISITALAVNNLFYLLLLYVVVKMFIGINNYLERYFSQVGGANKTVRQYFKATR